MEPFDVLVASDTRSATNLPTRGIDAVIDLVSEKMSICKESRMSKLLDDILR